MPSVDLFGHGLGTTKRMAETLQISWDKLTMYQLVIRILLAHPQYV